jgi:hypothetical protein
MTEARTHYFNITLMKLADVSLARKIGLKAGQAVLNEEVLKNLESPVNPVARKFEGLNAYAAKIAVSSINLAFSIEDVKNRGMSVPLKVKYHVLDVAALEKAVGVDVKKAKKGAAVKSVKVKTNKAKKKK